ncbi:hypothetical protein [Alkalilacustris brevis]|uniref:hypothetical protein n=1 Tax=Alkalilacustris brevis TaxID=2026338 RepID=UPI000E0DE28B|nr:hypothetical protein [Alkalilacustris brevis]
MTVPKHQRDAFEATDEALNHIDGLISALDVIEDQIRLVDEMQRESKAFRIIRPILEEKMAEMWKLRNREWQSIGGKVGADVLAEIHGESQQGPEAEQA